MKTRMIIATVLIWFFGGCGELLDTEIKDPQVFSSQKFAQDTAGYEKLLAGIYANLILTSPRGIAASNITGLHADFSHYLRSLWYMQEVTTDEAKWTWTGDVGTADLNTNQYTADNPLISGFFSRSMLGVSLANDFLRQTASIASGGASAALKDNIKTYRAEARFLRALYYYYMLDFFGMAPFSTEKDIVGTYQPPQYNQKELFSYIESELSAIIPDLNDPLTGDYARVDKVGVYMLLAKLYLNANAYIGENKYDKCIEYVEKIINSPYKLCPNYLYLFMADNDKDPARSEIIFPVVSDGINTMNYGPPTMLVNGQVGAPENNGEQFGIKSGGWAGAIRVPKEFSALFLSAEYSKDDRNTLITKDRDISITQINLPSVGYLIAKWSNRRASDGKPGTAIEIVDTDFPMFRLADAYLMYAEAFLRGGGGSAANAVNYINLLRDRAKNPNKINNNDLTLDLILNERLVELHWEGFRRQDLIRFSKYTGGNYNWQWKGNSLNGISIDPNRKLFPVPTKNLLVNPKLKQNPGY